MSNRLIRYEENGVWKYASVKDIGDLTKLQTLDKKDIVSAINELVAKGDASQIPKDLEDRLTVIETDMPTIKKDLEDATLEIVKKANLDFVNGELNKKVNFELYEQQYNTISTELLEKLDLTTYQNQYNQIVSDIGKKADASALDSKVTELNKSIAIQSTEVQNAKSDIANLDTKVDTTKTELVKTIDTVKGSVTAIDTKLDTAKSEIKQTTDGITQSVQKVETKVDNIQVGGRNLIRNSNFARGTELWTYNQDAKLELLDNGNMKVNFPSDSISTPGLKYKEKLTLEAGEYVATVRMNLDKMNASSVSINLYPHTSLRVKPVADEGMKDYVAHLVVTQDVEINFFVMAVGVKTGDSMEIERIKLEKGNIPTDYTLSPQDIDDDFTSVNQSISNVDQKADSIKSSVTTLGETVTQQGSTISSQGTSITQLNNSIISKAEKTDVYTKTESDGKISTAVTNAKTEIKQTTDGISQTVSTISGKVTGIDGEIDIINSNVSAIDQKTDSIQSTVTKLNTTVDGQGTRISNAETTIGQHTTSINLKANATDVYKKTEVDTSLGKKVDTTTYDNKMSAIDVSIDGINQTVTSQTTKVDNLTGTVTGHTSQISTIDQKADGIAVRVSKTEGDITGLNGRVGTAETNITANTKAINLRATQSSVDTLSGRVTSAEGEIDVQAGQIAQRVTKTEFDDAVGVNKWIASKYPITGTDLAQTPPSFPLIKGMQATEVKEISDASTLSIFTGTSQITHLFTNVKLAIAKTIKLSLKYDNSVAIYMNGARIYENKSNSQAVVSVSLALRVGWNTIEILHGQKDGSPVLILGTTISSQVDKMTTVIGVGDKNETRLAQAETSIVQNSEAITLKANQTEVTGIGNRVTTAESELVVQAKQIASKVGQTDFNAYSQRLETAESTITQQSNEIKSKVSQTDYNLLNGRVSTAESTITQQGKAIELKANQTDLNSVTGRLSTTEATLTTQSDQIATRVTKDEYKEGIADTKKYVQSRGENLVTNGTGLMGDNTNFSTFTFDGSNVFAGAGSFFTDKQNTTLLNDEYIPVDASKKYRISTMAKSSLGIRKHYLGIMSYDIDKNTIVPYNFYGSKFNAVELTKPLKKGDTEIHVSNVAEFVDKNADNDHTHSIVLWGYKNSYGYEYPVGTYSRFTQTASWNNGAIDRVNKIIKLSKPFSVVNPYTTDGSFPIGHKVSPTASGSNYQYTVLSNKAIPTEWTYFEGMIEGNGISDKLFPHGTAFVRIMFMINRNATGVENENVWFNSVELSNTSQEDKAKGYTDSSLVPVIDRLSSAEATITQTAKDITLKVSQTQVDNSINSAVNPLKSRLDSAETTITQTAKDIVLKADKSTTYTKGEVDSEIGKVDLKITNANTKITQNADKINLKANSTDVYTKVQANELLGGKANTSELNALVTRVTSAETNIDQTSTAISLKANKTDVYTKAETNTELGKKANQTDVTTINSTLSDMTNDLKVTPVEKSALKTDWDRIKSEYTQVLANAQVSTVAVSTTAFTSAYNLLNSTSPKIEAEILATMTNTYTFGSTTLRDTFKTKMASYFSELEKIRKAINDKINTTSNTANSTANTLKNTTVPALTTRVTNAESSLTVQAEQIESKVGKTEYNTAISGLTSRLSSAETSITQTSSSLSLKANASEVYTKGQVDTSLGGKADTSVVNALTTRVSNAEQKITSSAIISTVTSSTNWTTLNGSVNTALTDSSKAKTDSSTALSTANTLKNTTVPALATRVSTAEQKITDSAIVSTVTGSTTYVNAMTGKVSTDKVISSINQTAETIKISVEKLDIEGKVSFSTLDTSTRTKITNAENNSSNAVTTANAKSRTFIATPTVPYNAGDIWKNGTMTYISTVTRTTGSYTVADWVKTGDVTSANTSADTSKVNGIASSTVTTNASNGASAYSDTSRWKMTGKTTINGGQIEADTILVTSLKAGTIDADKIGISNSKVTLDSNGVFVKDGSFGLETTGGGKHKHYLSTGTLQKEIEFVNHLLNTPNLILDHSFEMLESNGISGNYFHHLVKPQTDMFGLWTTVGTPRLFTNYFGGSTGENIIPFSEQMVMVNTSNFVKQSISVKKATKYTVSFHLKNAIELATATECEIFFQMYTEYGVAIGGTTYARFPMPTNDVDNTSVRHAFTFETPNNTSLSYVELGFRTVGSNWGCYDGIQMVVGDKAVTYNNDDEAWRIRRGGKDKHPLINAYNNGHLKVNQIDTSGNINVAGKIFLEGDSVITTSTRGWLLPTLTSGVTNLGQGYQTAGYYKDAQGFIHLRGFLQGASNGKTLFTLPVGYRPSSQRVFATFSNHTYNTSRVDIYTDGKVVSTTSGAWVLLDGIMFNS